MCRFCSFSSRVSIFLLQSCCLSLSTAGDFSCQMLPSRGSSKLVNLAAAEVSQPLDGVIALLMIVNILIYELIMRRTAQKNLKYSFKKVQHLCFLFAHYLQDVNQNDVTVKKLFILKIAVGIINVIDTSYYFKEKQMFPLWRVWFCEDGQTKVQKVQTVPVCTHVFTSSRPQLQYLLKV